MIVTKKENRARQFIPYTLTVEINEETEHNGLLEDINIVEHELRKGYGYDNTIKNMFHKNKPSAIGNLLNYIKNHTK